MDQDQTATQFGGSGTEKVETSEGRAEEAPQGSLDQILSTIERREILSALNRASGQRTLAARLLGISRSRLYRRMEALGIDPNHVNPRGDA